MTPQPARIAHYQITAKLGEGGMGAVYRATDTKLNREVAIKILPDALAADPDRLARFSRESQVLASLNHPNIAAIYGVEERALIMELVDGPTLAERIAAGVIPLDEALPIARQIAEALEYAHDRGIIHRDLKPANIKVTPDGRVKVLDFGLAKALSTDPAGADPASSPTLTMRATMAGVIMGTAGYMAPEQAKGKQVDRRADIWAFGIVLAEMLTGREMYTGETVSEILAAVIMKEPEIPGSVPPHIANLLRRCLERDPRLRLQAIGEARIAIGRPTPATSPVPVAPQRRQFGRLPLALIATLAVALVAAVTLLYRATRSLDRPLMRFSVDLGPDSVRGTQTTAVLSPDGTRIVYPVRTATGSFQLATRTLDQSNVTVLAGTEGAEQHFFSPDSQWVAFFANQALKKISVHGGAAVTLCPTVLPPRGGDWGENDYIVATLDSNHLFRVPAGGGTPEVIGKPEEHSERTWRYPQVLNSGKTILFTGSAAPSGSGYEDANIEVLSRETGKVKVVQRGGYYGRYLPSGHLIYLHQGVLFAAPFDQDRLEVRGTPVPILDAVAGQSGQGGGQLSFSSSGTFVFVEGKALNLLWDLSWIGPKGTIKPVWTTSTAVLSPKISPDGKQLMGLVEPNLQLIDLDKGAARRLTFSRNEVYRYPLWSADGRHIFYSVGSPPSVIVWARADGSSQPLPLISEPGAQLAAMSFSAANQTLAYALGGTQVAEIRTVPLDLSDPERPKAGTPKRLGDESTGMTHPAFSPDGRWIAYTSYATSPGQVFVRPFPGTPASGKWQISDAGGAYPAWSKTSHELLYLASDQRLMAVNWQATGETFAAEPPHPWTENRIAALPNYMSYDLAPDGKRILAVPLVSPVSSTDKSIHVTVLLNFFDELKRRIPVSSSRP